MAKEPKVKSEQIDSKPGRRQFQPGYKLRIPQEIDASREKRVTIGDILRREGRGLAQSLLHPNYSPLQMKRGYRTCNIDDFFMANLKAMLGRSSGESRIKRFGAMGYLRFTISIELYMT